MIFRTELANIPPITLKLTFIEINNAHSFMCRLLANFEFRKRTPKLASPMYPRRGTNLQSRYVGTQNPIALSLFAQSLLTMDEV